MLFFLCMDYVGAVNMSLRTANSQSTISRDFHRDRYVTYLTGEGRVAAVRLFARWACLFRREPLQHCAIVEFVAPCQ